MLVFYRLYAFYILQFIICYRSFVQKGIEVICSLLVDNKDDDFYRVVWSIQNFSEGDLFSWEELFIWDQ